MSENSDSTVLSSSVINDDGLHEESMPPSCHNQDNFADSQANIGCELLCSAIGHVMLDYEEPLIDGSAPALETESLLADLFTRQLIVEKRPPK